MNKRQRKKEQSARRRYNNMRLEVVNYGFIKGLCWGAEMGETCPDESGADIARRLRYLIEKARLNPPQWGWNASPEERKYTP